MGELTKVNKNIHEVAMETELNASNMFIEFCPTPGYMNTGCKTSDKVYLFGSEEGYLTPE